MKKVKNALIGLGVVGALVVPASAGVGTTTVTFENGTEGFTGAAVVDAAGGNPGANFHTQIPDTFGVTYSANSNGAFVDDYSQYSEMTLSIDVKVSTINFFGQDVSLPWLVELRDYDNVTTGLPYASVWYKFGDISQEATGDWTNFSVTIDDVNQTALPAGWGGFGDEDPNTFDPILPADRTFADVLAGIDEVAFTTFEPGFFFGFTAMDMRVDNISITKVPAPGAGVLMAVGMVCAAGRRRG